MHLKVNCKQATDVTGWDNFTGPLSIGSVSSALFDYDTSLPSSVALYSNIAWTGSSGTTSVLATQHGWEAEVWNRYWYVGVASGGNVLTLSGLNPGEVYTLRLAGHNPSSRDVTFNAIGATNGPILYVDNAGAIPTIYVELTGVVPVDGIIDISITGSNVNLYLNAIEFTSAVGTISTTMTTDFLEPVNFTDQTSFSFNNTTQSEASVSVTAVTVPPSNTMEYSVEWNNPPAYGDAVECIIATGHNYVTEGTGVPLDPQTLSSGTNCIKLPPETNGPLAIPDVTFGQYLDYDTSTLFNADPAIYEYTFNGVLPPGTEFDTTTGRLFGYPYALGLSGTISITGTSTIGVATTTDDTFSVLSSGSDLVVTAPTTADGDPLTVTTTGYSFGVKPQVAPRLTIHGTDIREDGVVNVTSPEVTAIQGMAVDRLADDPNSIWQNGSASTHAQQGFIDKTDLPHAGVDQTYRFEHDCSLGDPMVMAVPNYVHDQVYVYFKTKSIVDITHLKSLHFNGSITGTFDTGLTDFDEGEPVTISPGTTGVVVAIDLASNIFHLTTADVSTTLYGATVTGVNSGASVVLTDSLVIASAKTIRFYENTVFSNDSIHGVGSSLNTMIAISDHLGAEFQRINVPCYSPWSPLTYGTWNQLALTCDYRAALGIIRHEVNNTDHKYEINQITTAYRSPDSGPALSLFGMDTERDPYNGMSMFADIYVDDTFQRIVIANAATWDAVTHYEPVIPTAWADKSVTAEIYKGMLGAVSGSWVYVFDNGPSGLPLNSSGVLVP